MLRQDGLSTPWCGGHRFDLKQTAFRTSISATYVSHTPQGGRLKPRCRSSWRNANTLSCHEFTLNILSFEQHDSLNDGNIMLLVTTVHKTICQFVVQKLDGLEREGLLLADELYSYLCF